MCRVPDTCAVTIRHIQGIGRRSGAGDTFMLHSSALHSMSSICALANALMALSTCSRLSYVPDWRIDWRRLSASCVRFMIIAR